MQRSNRMDLLIRLLFHAFLMSIIFIRMAEGQIAEEKKYYGTFKSGNPYMMNKPLFGDKVLLKATDRPQLIDLKDGKIRIMVNGEYGYVYAEDLKSDYELTEFKNMIVNGLLILDEQERKRQEERKKSEENQIDKYASIKEGYGDSSIFIIRPRTNEVALFEKPNGRVITMELQLYEPLKVIKYYDRNYVMIRGVNDKSIVGYVMLYYVDKDKELEQWVLDEEMKEQKENERLAYEREKALKAKRLKELTAKYGPDKAKKLMNGEIWIGMTISEAMESRGNPRTINETVTAKGKSHQFVYEDTYLYFDNGILTTYQKQY